MKYALQLIPAALLAFSLNAQADVSITIEQVGANVVIKGSGSLTPEGAACFAPQSAPASSMGKDAPVDALFIPASPFLLAGDVGQLVQCGIIDPIRTGTALTGQSNIGAGTLVSGNPFLMIAQADSDALWVSFPIDSASALDVNFSALDVNFSAVFPDQSFESLGLIEGSGYTWTWSTVPAAGRASAPETQSLSISVQGPAAPVAATPVPTLGVFGLMGLASAIGAAGIAMNRRRKQ